jgi:penicillin amidase
MLVADGRTIGLFVTGRVPIRKAGDGAAPVPGDGSHDWIGWAAGEQLPHSVSPDSGRLVNANEPVAPADFPVFMGRDGFGDWRAERIRQMLAASDRHTPADFARMQVDFVNLFARQVLPVLLATPGVAGPSATALALLKGWDGTAGRDLPQPLIFNAWMSDFYYTVLRRAGAGSGLGAPVADFVSFVLSPAGAHWCGGDCGPLLRESLDTAVTDLRGRFGDDPAAWRWGAAHQAIFAHPILRNIPILGSLSTIHIPSGGDDDTVGRGGMNAEWQSVHGASYRGVYDLSDLDRSLFMITPGQSGNPLSSHARDFVTRWRDGATITLGPVAATITGTIQLTP